MDTRETFVSAVQDHFNKLTPMLVMELAPAVRKASEHQTKFLLVEYDSPHFSQDFPVSLWPMNSKGRALGDGHWFLKGKAVVVPPDIYEAEEYDSIEPWDTASKLLEEWFISKWPLSRVPAFIGHHDSHFKRDLRTGERIAWDKIIERADG